MVDAAILLLFRAEDVRLAHDARAVFKKGFKLHITVRHRQHAPGDREHLPHHGDRFFKAARHAVERGEQKIAERLPAQLPLGKAVVKQFFHHRLGICKRLHALAHVARRQNAHVAAQHTAAAAIIGHGDDGRQPVCIFFQSAQHRGEARPAADGNDLRSHRCTG